MNKNIMKNLTYCLAVVILSVSLSSCLVSKKKYDQQAALAKKYMDESKDCGQKLDRANENIKSLNDQLGKLTAEIEDLKNKNLSLSEKTDRLTKANADAAKMYEDLKNQYQDLGKKSTNDRKKLSLQLADKEATLNQKQAELEQLSDQLAEREKRFKDLENLAADREKRVKDLQDLIARKDSALANLKRKITDALTSFNNDELKVTQKDGKIYVSMSEKLLFKTGSFAVDAKGKSAIVKVAEVLNKLSDVTIVVEGHTDNTPYSLTKTEVKNNWDLSAMRAAAVTNIIVKDGHLDPTRVVAEGHSEFSPVESNDTEAGRSKNRRIELVLSPDLKEIFKILDSAK